MVNTIPERFDNEAGKFRGAKLVDGDVGADPDGVPSVGTTPSGVFTVGFGSGSATLFATGDDGGANPPKRVDGGESSVRGDAVNVLGEKAQAALAWKTRAANGTGVSIQERPLRGKARTGRVSAPKGGAIEELRMAGSGLGDALVAWRQGIAGDGQISAAIVNAPPLKFPVVTPIRFVPPRRAGFTWEAAPDALSDVRYTTVLDGRVQGRGLKVRRFRPGRRGLEDGVYKVHVIATDGAGQQTISDEADLKVDGTAPRASVSVKGSAVSVRVVDGRRRRTSGPKRAGIAISFGDGKRVKRQTRAKHRYDSSGSYTIVVKTRDRAGNRGRVVRRVKVG